MDENLTTAGEPTIVESTVTPTDTGVVATNTDIADGSQVIETSTQMDNNVTYNNIDITNNVTDPTVTNPTEPTNNIIIDPNKSLTDNVYDNIVTHEHDTNLVENSGSAMKNFFLKDYDYDVDEVGSYWVGGAMNDVKNQMSFLNVLINEEMYDALDLQKYYFDNNLATARAYAAKKDKETAYNYYRAAQEKAIAEGELTGWYMPAEGRYMLGQYTIAMNILENPDASQEERDKADRIKGTVEDWFGANKIGTQGIKTLGMMNYEETVRHNKVSERLQKQANAAAASAAGAQLAATLWDIAELELVWRADLDDNGVIGHTDAERRATHSDLFQYLNEHDAWKGFYKFSETRDMAWVDGTAKQMAKIHDVNFSELEHAYETSVGNGIVKNTMGENGTHQVTLDQMNKLTFKLEPGTKITLADGTTITGSEITGDVYWLSTSDGTYLYTTTKEGGTVQITDAKTKFENGISVDSWLKREDVSRTLGTGTLKDTDGRILKIGDGLINSNVSKEAPIKYDNLTFGSDKDKKAIDKYVTKGKYKIKYGYSSKKGNNILLDEEGNTFELKNGTLKEIDEDKIVKNDIKNGKEKQRIDANTNVRNSLVSTDITFPDEKRPGDYKVNVYLDPENPEAPCVYTVESPVGFGFSEESKTAFGGREANAVEKFLFGNDFDPTNNDLMHLTGQDEKTITYTLSKSDLDKLDFSKTPFKTREEFEKAILGYASKTPTQEVLESSTTEVKTTNDKNKKDYTKAPGGGAASSSSPNLLDNPSAEGSTYETFEQHNTNIEDKPEGTPVNLGEVDFTSDNNNLNNYNEQKPNKYSEQKPNTKGGKK